MAFNIGKFVQLVVGATMATIIVVLVAIPIISENQVGVEIANSAAINSILNILPIIMIVGILLAIVSSAILKSRSN